MAAGERAVAVAGAGRPRAAAPDAERAPLRPDGDGLLLPVGGGRAHAVVPPSPGGEECGRRRLPLGVPGPDPVQAASGRGPQRESRRPDVPQNFCWQRLKPAVSPPDQPRAEGAAEGPRGPGGLSSADGSCRSDDITAD